jgi:chitinase
MRRLLVVVSALVIATASVPVALSAAPITASPAQKAGGSGGRAEVVGYFIQWGIYDRAFFVKNLVDNGSAGKLTVINYAFGNVAPNAAGSVVCQSGDTWADYGRPTEPENSVDGVGDIWGEPLRGNFRQLQKLKTEYPDLKVDISLGGWTWSKYFSDAALTPQSRETFVRSCIDLFIDGNLPVVDEAGGPGAAAGVFDGFDLDWEWPGSEGNPGNIIRPEDKQNFTKLVAEFRRQLDEHAKSAAPDTSRRHGDGDRDYLLTAFLPADDGAIAAGFEVRKLFRLFDFATFQGYDLAGPWDLTATNHHSKLFAPRGDPQPEFSVDRTVRTLTRAGAPARKLVMGIPFFGHGWTGVTDVNHGLYQPATAAAAGTFEAGVEDYHVLATLSDQGFTRYWDQRAQVPWLFDGTTFWTFDDSQSIGAKTDYIRRVGLRGAMVWDLTGDTADGELMSAIFDGLHPRRH